MVGKGAPVSDCIECFARLQTQAHAEAEAWPVLDLTLTQQPLGMLVAVLLVVYAVLTLARRFADRVDPPPAEWRPPPIDVPPPSRVWRFPPNRRAGPWGRI